MPLDTTAEGWERGEATRSIHDRVLAFLRRNDDWAFHARELADEVLDTDWALAHKRERERERLGEEEFQQRLEAGEYDGQLLEDSGGKAVADSIQTQAIIDICNALVRAGELEVRAVSAEASNIPDQDDDVRYYTYAGDDEPAGAASTADEPTDGEGAAGDNAAGENATGD